MKRHQTADPGVFLEIRIHKLITMRNCKLSKHLSVPLPKLFFHIVYTAILILFSFLLSTQVLAVTESGEADFTPWSGWWWPTTQGGLATGLGYRGHPAPMEKYELLKEGAYPGNATEFELSRYYDPDAISWYGQCEAWAGAAVLEHIEFYPSVIDNIVFYVGDKKGLLTACHHDDNRIRESAHNADTFHWWLTHYIGELGTDFYADLDAGEQIWNYPVFKYELEMTENGDQIDVQCQIWYVDDQVDPDFQGAVIKMKIYTYTLYLQDGEISGGEWTGNSEENHPDQLILPLGHRSLNPYLDYDFVKSIAETRDDELEPMEPANLSPGDYYLILLDEDNYILSCHLGDTLLLTLKKIDDFSESIHVNMTDADGVSVYSDELTDTAELSITADNPPYRLTFSRSDYGGGGVYRVLYDVKKTFEFANTKIQKGEKWGGFAIANTGQDTCDTVYVVGYRKDGTPIETFFGPFSLEPGEKKTLFVNDMEERAIDSGDLFGIKIAASKSLHVLNLFGSFERNMSCYSYSSANHRIVIPEISNWWDTSGKNVSWGIYNPFLTTSSSQLTLFSRAGIEIDTLTINVEANRWVHYNGTTSPFSGNGGNGWVLIEDQDDLLLKGYTEWSENGIYKAESLPALVPGDVFLIPHVESSLFWDTQIVLINVSDTDNEVVFTRKDPRGDENRSRILGPGEKQTLDIMDLYPDTPFITPKTAWISISASDEMAGYVCFNTPEDEMCYPFLTPDHIGQSFALTHVASSRYWWTALNFLNPFEEAVAYRLMPYDATGRLMSELEARRFVEPLSKTVFTLHSVFGENAADISFLKIQVESGPGLTGFFGYGNPDMSMLTGSILTETILP